MSVDPENLFDLHPDPPFEKWELDEFEKAGIDVTVLREDLLHPWIQGNKWHKLKPWLKMAVEEKKVGLSSMGGPYSNHLIALGFAALKMNLPFQAFIKGDETEWKDNEAIRQLRDWNAEIIPTSRSQFRTLHQEKSKPELALDSEIQWIPMGGSDPLAIQSVSDWARQIELHVPDFTHLVLPVGSGGTVAGFCSGLSPEKIVLGISSLKVDVHYLQTEFQRLTNPTGPKQPEWILDYHFGGFGKSNAELKAFCRAFFDENGFRIEPVYSGKAFFAVSDLARKGHFPRGSRLLLVHTGGIFPWNFP